MKNSFDIVVKSPINRSPSKQLYSFTKASRFQKNNKQSCDKFYNIASSLKTQKAPSLGYGKKTDLINKTVAPGVGRYQKQSDFQLNYKIRRGYSFGSQQKKSSTINLKELSYKPGPGKYEHSKYNKHANLSFSIGGKFKDNQSRHLNKLGPGQYQSINLNDNGKYYFSKFQSSKCGKIGNSKRFSQKLPQIPGPGTYRADQKQNINKDGVYFNSRLRTNPVRSFSRSLRPSLANKTLTPGPGAYSQFSEFALRNKSSFQIR